jgi:hypothetical protein
MLPDAAVFAVTRGGYSAAASLIFAHFISNSRLQSESSSFVAWKVSLPEDIHLLIILNGEEVAAAEQSLCGCKC